MIQEILDYLLIKAQFVCMTEEELLSRMSNEDSLKIYLDIICGIMEQDVFFFTSEHITNKLEKVINKTRFESPHDAQTVQDFNEIIGAINFYNKISVSERQFISKEWINEQVQKRKLLFSKSNYYDLDCIYQFIKDDYVYAKYLLALSNNDFIIHNPFSFLGTVNYIIDQFPLVFAEKPEIMPFCYTLLSQKLVTGVINNYFYSRMTKKTLLALDDISEKLEYSSNPKYKIIIKKDSN